MSTASSAISIRPIGPALPGIGTGNQRTQPQPIPARRADLIVREQEYRGQKVYYVKDPLTLKYYRFAPAEFHVFDLLDGKRTIDDVQREFGREFTLRDVSTGDILPLVQRWQTAGLLQEAGVMATGRILAAKQRAETGRWTGWISKILYLKVRAFDPDRLLNFLYPFVRWMFSPLGIGVAIVTMLSAVVLVTARFEEFTSQPEIRDLHAFFNLQNIVWMWLAVGIVKVLHEFGHGLTCKHFGGECHAMGLLFMCLTPCMYCDVSDSWMLPNKWHRIAIAAAGIYVELLMAALATFVWWSTVPGIVHSIAFSTMLFGSAQTILINANPLMRFDGYYMMSDLLEVPNLRQKSYSFAKYYLKKWFWGTRDAAPGSGGLCFMAYAVTASAFRASLTFGMVWFFYKILEPYKLQALGWVLASLAFTNLAILPIVTAARSAIRNPAGSRPSSWWRPFFAASLLTALVVSFFLAPIPNLAYAVLTMETDDSSLVSTSTRGRIVRQFVAPGQYVRQGDPLIELENFELRIQTEKMEQERDLLQVQFRAASAVLDQARAQAIALALKEVEAQLEVCYKRINDLILRAPCDGRVIPEAEVDSFEPVSSSIIAPLRRSYRSLLDSQNIGAILESGTDVCHVSPTDECVAVAIMSQSRIEFVQPDQVATVKLDAFPDVTFLGTVQQVSVQDVEKVPPQLLNTNGSELPSIVSGPTAGHLAETHYRIRIKLTEPAHGGDLSAWKDRLRTGLRGRTWIRTGSQTAAQMTWRYICQIMQL